MKLCAACGAWDMKPGLTCKVCGATLPVRGQVTVPRGEKDRDGNFRTMTHRTRNSETED